MQNIPNPDLYDAQRWAEDAAADEEAELLYRRMLEDEDDAPPVEHDLF